MNSLKDAEKAVNSLIDVYLETEGYVPSWLYALHESVQRDLNRQNAPRRVE